jgi:hypothetical protein
VFTGSSGTVKLAGDVASFAVPLAGAIGRLVPEDVIGLIRYLREHAASTTTA